MLGYCKGGRFVVFGIQESNNDLFRLKKLLINNDKVIIVQFMTSVRF